MKESEHEQVELEDLIIDRLLMNQAKRGWSIGSKLIERERSFRVKTDVEEEVVADSSVDRDADRTAHAGGGGDVQPGTQSGTARVELLHEPVPLLVERQRPIPRAV